MLKKIRKSIELWFGNATNKDYQLFREEMGKNGLKPAGRVLVHGDPDISTVDTFKVSFDGGKYWTTFSALAGTRTFRGTILSRKSSDTPRESWLVYDKKSRSFFFYEQSHDEKWKNVKSGSIS